jgi:hypothetical protein
MHVVGSRVYLSFNYPPKPSIGKLDMISSDVTENLGTVKTNHRKKHKIS